MRKFSAARQIDIFAAERLYVTNWILKAIFDHPLLTRALLLRGGSALRYAYAQDFPLADDPEFLVTTPMDETPLRDAASESLNKVAEHSGLKFPLVAFERGIGRIEYTGPLGRRSAAQPRITLLLFFGTPRLEPASVPLQHPFEDTCTATLRVIAVEELVGESLALLAASPRARDVFDLWFALTRLSDRVNVERACALAHEIAQAKSLAMPRMSAPIKPSQRTAIERAWDKALASVKPRPTLAQVESDLRTACPE